MTRVAYNATSGNQMWYLSLNSSNYYKISNLGIKAPTAGQGTGDVDHVLALGSSNNLILTRDTGANAEQWGIGRVVTPSITHYYLYNRSNTSLLITLVPNNAVQLASYHQTNSSWVLEPVTTNIFITDVEAEYSGWSGTRPVKINFIIDDSAITTDLPFTMYQDAASRWNGITPNIIVNGAYRTSQTPPNGFNVSVVGDNSANRIGFCDSLVNYFTSGGVTTVTIVYVKIILNPSSLGAYTDTTDRRKTIIHEMGHALQLGDVNLASPAPQVVAIMNQHQPSLDPLVPVLPSGYDRATLRARW